MTTVAEGYNLAKQNAAADTVDPVGQTTTPQIPGRADGLHFDKISSALEQRSCKLAEYGPQKASASVWLFPLLHPQRVDGQESCPPPKAHQSASGSGWVLHARRVCSHYRCDLRLRQLEGRSRLSTSRSAASSTAAAYALGRTGDYGCGHSGAG